MKYSKCLCVLICCLSQFLGIYCDCSVDTCQWEPWQQWRSCNGECGGGSQTRLRELCCKSEFVRGRYLTQQCLDDCGIKDWNDFYDYKLCTGQCYNRGKYNGLICDCRQGSTGNCCEYGMLEIVP